MHANDFGTVATTLAGKITLGFFLSFLRLLDGIADDFLVDLDLLKLSVIAFFEGIEEICGRMDLAIVLDLLVAFELDR